MLGKVFFSSLPQHERLITCEILLLKFSLSVTEGLVKFQ